MINMPALKASTIEFLWVDGRGSLQTMARIIAESPTTQTVEGVNFLYAKFGANEFARAFELFKLIGNKKTTQIAIDGNLANKSYLGRVFECYNKALRSRAQNYCQIEIREANIPSPIDITLRINFLGISPAAEVPLAPRETLNHPCKLCYYATMPQPSTLDQWTATFEDIATQVHANICPRFSIV